MSFKNKLKNRRGKSQKSAQTSLAAGDKAKIGSAVKTLCSGVKAAGGAAAAAGSESELLSLSEIAARMSIHRNTVARKLQFYEIKPAVDMPNKKLFEFTEELEDALLADDEDPRIRVQRLANLKMQNELKELNLAITRGEVLHVSEMTDITQRVFGTLIKRLRKLPERCARQLHELDSSPALERALRRELEQVFADTRRDHAAYLTPPESADASEQSS